MLLKTDNPFESTENSSLNACGTCLTISNYTAKKKLELYYKDVFNEEIKCILCAEESPFAAMPETTLKVLAFDVAEAV